MKLAQLPILFSKGDLIQAQLEKMGVGQKKAAKAGAIADLMSGDINGYYKNMFESKTGYDPGRLGGALLAGAAMGGAYGCCSPASALAKMLKAKAGKGVPTGKVKARFSYHTPFGKTQIQRRDLNGQGFLGKLKGAALEHRLNTDPSFRALFEAKVGGKYIPDGRTDGQVTVRKFKPNLRLHSNPIANTVANALKRFQQQIADVMKGLQGNQGSQSNGIQGEPGSAVSKLGPGACFEDLVAAFMQDVVREQQKEAKEKMNELNDLNAQSKKLRAQGATGSNSSSGSSSSSSSSSSSGSSSSKESANSELDTIGESRQMKMEELKQIMQRLSSMQQALSNVLNTMHQGAMNSIRNIRA